MIRQMIRSIFNQIGTIADRVRKSAERTWISVPANDVFHAGVALHATQLLINQIFGPLKPRGVMQRKIRVRLSLFSALLIHKLTPPQIRGGGILKPPA
jgi:hypothetical protein